MNGAFAKLFEPIGRNDVCDSPRKRRRRDTNEMAMTAPANFESVKGGAVIAVVRRCFAGLRRCGALLLMGMHETRRQQAARIIADRRYLAGPGRPGPIDAGRLHARPQVVPLRKAPATQPSPDPTDVPLGWPHGGDGFF
jgi:hypothetical protein